MRLEELSALIRYSDLWVQILLSTLFQKQVVCNSGNYVYIYTLYFSVCKQKRGMASVRGKNRLWNDGSLQLNRKVLRLRADKTLKLRNARNTPRDSDESKLHIDHVYDPFLNIR